MSNRVDKKVLESNIVFLFRESVEDITDKEEDEYDTEDNREDPYDSLDKSEYTTSCTCLFLRKLIFCLARYALFSTTRDD
jgi:hypothetical protein